MQVKKLKQIKRAIAGLEDVDLVRLRDWLDAYDVRRIERRIRAKIAAGKLDELAEAALADFRTGRTRWF